MSGLKSNGATQLISKKRLYRLALQLQIVSAFAVLQSQLKELYQSIKQQQQYLYDAYIAMLDHLALCEEKNNRVQDETLRKMEQRIERLQESFDAFMQALACDTKTENYQLSIDQLASELNAFAKDDECILDPMLVCDYHMNNAEIVSYIEYRLQQQVEKVNLNDKSNVAQTRQINDCMTIKDQRHIDAIAYNLPKILAYCDSKSIVYNLEIISGNQLLLDRLKVTLADNRSSRVMPHTLQCQLKPMSGSVQKTNASICLESHCNSAKDIKVSYDII